MINLGSRIVVDALLKYGLAVKTLEGTQPAGRAPGTEFFLLALIEHLQQIVLLRLEQRIHLGLGQHLGGIGKIPAIGG